MERLQLSGYLAAHTQRMNHTAYIYAWTINDTRNTPLMKHVDHPHILRTEQQTLDWLENLIQWGRAQKEPITPIIACLDLLTTIHTIQWDMHKGYQMKASARTTGIAYYIDLTLKDGTRVLRLWDVQHMCKGGLNEMARLANCENILTQGDPNTPNRQHTPQTPLTTDEKLHILRTIQIIPRYLQWLCQQNPWLKPGMLGSRAMTQTSLVRIWASQQISPLPIPGPQKRTCGSTFISLCTHELPPTWKQYAWRRASMRGGYSFCATRTAGIPQRNVLSLDADSMFHAFIPQRIPTGFHTTTPTQLQAYAEADLKQATIPHMLNNYIQPLPFAFHAHIRFNNLQLKPNTIFHQQGIGLLSEGRFLENLIEDNTTDNPPSVKTAGEQTRRTLGYHDTAVNAVYAMGHLMYADQADLYLTETELACMNLVYKWTSMHAIEGEATWNYSQAPDYILLQSMNLYTLKTHAKQLINTYQENTPYTQPIPPDIPDSISQACRTGKLTRQELDAWYQGSVKARLNSIYGTQAQDLYRAEYMIEPQDADLAVNPTTLVTPETFQQHTPQTPRVLYTYGMRIAGRSRLHMLIAMTLIHNTLPDTSTLAGDTDSLHIALNQHTPQEILNALTPLHQATRSMIIEGSQRIKRQYPDQYSPMLNAGQFQIQPPEPDTQTWDWDCEYWQKARTMITNSGRCAITCSTLPQPTNKYTLADAIQQLHDTKGPEYALTHAIGWNVTILHDTSHTWQPTHPQHKNMYTEYVRDHQGGYMRVYQHEAPSPQPTDLQLGDLMIPENMETVEWIERIHHRPQRTDTREISRQNPDYGEPI